MCILDRSGVICEAQLNKVVQWRPSADRHEDTWHVQFYYMALLICGRTYYMMTPSNGHIFRVTGHLCEEFTGNRWIPRTKAAQVTRSFDVFFDLRLNNRLSKQLWDWWFETPSRSLWRHCIGKNINMTCHLVATVGSQCWYHILSFNSPLITD